MHFGSNIEKEENVRSALKALQSRFGELTLSSVYETEAAVGAWRDSGGLPAWESESELFEADYDRVLPHFERVMEHLRTAHGLQVAGVRTPSLGITQASLGFGTGQGSQGFGTG